MTRKPYEPSPPRFLRGLLRCTVVLTVTLLLPAASPAQSLTGIGPTVPNTTLGLSPVAGTSEPRIQQINGEYQESHTDLNVKVLGGSVDIARS